jgi:hypothetical protein
MFIVILLAGGAGAGWWFFLRAPSPGEVVRQFVRATEDNDPEKIKSLLSQSTLNTPGFAEGFARGREFAAKNAKADEVKHEHVNIISTTYEGDAKDRAVVTCEPEDKSSVPSGTDSKQEIFLVKEEGKWKIDLMTTIQRAFSKAFGGKNMPGGGGSSIRGGSPTVPPASGRTAPRRGG